MGPMAQDFHSAFGLNGAEDKKIATVDASGVALAAIQGLQLELKDRDTKIAGLEMTLTADQQRIDKLEIQVAELRDIASKGGFHVSPAAGIGLGLGAVGFAIVRRREKKESEKRG